MWLILKHSVFWELEWHFPLPVLTLCSQLNSHVRTQFKLHFLRDPFPSTGSHLPG